MITRAYNTKILALICLSLLLNLGCKKKVVNQNPTIRFLQPNSNLVVYKDTLVSFVIEPLDNDGTIEKVELLLNETLLTTLTAPPYSYNWNIETIKNIGSNKIKAIAYDNNGATGETELIIDIKSYLSNWIGMYKGTSLHWSESPKYVNGQLQMVTDKFYKKVSVDVKYGDKNSCLKFVITYNDSIIDVKDNILFSNLGVHDSQWGSGSSYGTLKSSFNLDTLHYKYFSKCGIPCSTGIDFDIKKN